MKTIIACILVLIILGSCGDVINKKNETGKTTQVINPNQIDSTRIVLLELDGKYFKGKGKSNANLTSDEYSQIENLIKNHLEKYNNDQENHYSEHQIEYPNSKLGIDDFVISLAHYRRQYVAYFNENDQKEVWINCFCLAPNDEWKKAIFIASDGGNCFFQLTVNLTSNKILDDFWVNGNA